jgi:hypothetical protein
MDNIKPWQIVLIIVALAVLGFSVWKFGVSSNPENQLAGSLTLVDVETGQLYRASIRGEKTLLLPARRPGTELQALVPVFEDNGEWYLFERYRGVLRDVGVPASAVPNPNEPVVVLDEPTMAYN